MIHPLVIARDTDSKAALRPALEHRNLSSSFACYSNGFRQEIIEREPEVLVLEIGEGLPGPEIWEYIRQVKKEKQLPVIALMARESLDGFELNREIDDFLVAPYDARELVLRMNRLLHRSGAVTAGPIPAEGVAVNPDTCEVFVEGRKVDLTFKEYELIKLLAGNKGHVFTREVLLDKIWGYDYYGGDRTVDVHIRRLRSKIEKNRTYVETVRNIGYRFIKED